MYVCMYVAYVCICMYNVLYECMCMYVCMYMYACMLCMYASMLYMNEWMYV